MKRIHIAVLPLIFLLFCCASTNSISKEKNAPVWLLDEGRLSVFPSAEYVSSFAYGTTAEEAKSEAAASISNYIKTNVNSELNAEYSAVDKDGVTTAEKLINKRLQISSNNSLYQLEYTTPYFEQSSNMYACVAYINREKAFEYIRPKLDVSSKSFSDEYKKTMLVEDDFQKIIAIYKSQKQLENFYEVYDFGMAVKTDLTSQYKWVDELANESFANSNALKSKTVISIEVQNDNQNQIKNKLSKIFNDCGFSVTTEGDYKYLAYAEVSTEISKTEKTFYTYPSIVVKVKNNNDTEFSYSNTLSKAAGFDKDATTRKAFLMLEEDLENNLLK